MRAHVLHVSAHQELMMNYLRNFVTGDVTFHFEVARGSSGFRFIDDPAFTGTVYPVTDRHLSEARWLKDMYQLLRSRQFTHVHLHSSWAMAAVLPLAVGTDARRISHSHIDLPQPAGFGRIKRAAARAAINFLSEFRFACSRQAGEQMFSRPFTVLPNAIDYSRFRFDRDARTRHRREMGIGENEIVMGHVGHFHEQKNHLFLLDVFSEHINKHPNSRLVLVGSGDPQLRRTLSQLAISRGIAERVLLLGGRSDVSELYNIFDVFVFPSLFEGLPLSLIEAQVSGLPSLYSGSIPPEVAIAPFAQVLDLSLGSTHWATQVDRLLHLGTGTIAREARSMSVSNDFNANEMAPWLEQFYLSTVRV